MATQARHLHRLLAFLDPLLGDPLLGGAPLVVEPHHRPAVRLQVYTYTFKVDGAKLTGTAESQFGKAEITEGAVKGDEISFVETVTYEGNSLKIEYKGKISGDEIKFTRNVADMVTEEIVAKRAK